MSNIKPGLGSVGSYQISGMPHISGGDLTNTAYHGAASDGAVIEFPAVTRSITITNKKLHNGGAAQPIMIHFDTNETRTLGLSEGGNAVSDVRGRHRYVTLVADGDTITLNVRCRRIYISLFTPSGTGHYEMVANLTGIDEPIDYTGVSGISN